MFVEADTALEPDSEFQVEFTVPDTSIVVQPTARVVWRRPADHERGPGMGLQFLKLDRDAAQWLEQYVYERSTGVEAPAPARSRSRAPPRPTSAARAARLRRRCPS